MSPAACVREKFVLLGRGKGAHGRPRFFICFSPCCLQALAYGHDPRQWEDSRRDPSSGGTAPAIGCRDVVESGIHAGSNGATGFYDRAGMSPGVSWWRPATTTRWEQDDMGIVRCCWKLQPLWTMPMAAESCWATQSNPVEREATCFSPVLYRQSEPRDPA